MKFSRKPIDQSESSKKENLKGRVTTETPSSTAKIPPFYHLKNKKTSIFKKHLRRFHLEVDGKSAVRDIPRLRQALMHGQPWDTQHRVPFFSQIPLDSTMTIFAVRP